MREVEEGGYSPGQCIQRDSTTTTCTKILITYFRVIVPPSWCSEQYGDTVEATLCSVCQSVPTLISVRLLRVTMPCTFSIAEYVDAIYVYGFCDVNPLNTKRRPLYLKTQFVPRRKNFSSRL